MYYENIIKEIVNKIRTEKQQPTTREQKVYCLYLNYLMTEKN
jgi:hypothetical protein